MEIKPRANHPEIQISQNQEELTQEEHQGNHQLHSWKDMQLKIDMELIRKCYFIHILQKQSFTTWTTQDRVISELTLSSQKRSLTLKFILQL